MTTTLVDVQREVAALQRMTVKQLRVRYSELFAEETNAGNKAWLVKRIVWRMQAMAEGGLSERALRRADELANDADLRLSPPKSQAPVQAPAPAPAETPVSEKPARFHGDDRLPPPGTVLARPYKGSVVQVLVLESGFDYRGQVYPSLSAVARAVTGSHCNGYLFFKLGDHGDKR